MDHTLGDRDRGMLDSLESIQMLKEFSLGTTVNVRNGTSKPPLLKKFASKGTEHLPFQLRREPFTMRSVVSKRWPTRPFSLNILGSEEDRFETHSVRFS